MNWITFGTDHIKEAGLPGATVGADMIKAPPTAVTAPPGVPTQKPLSPWVPIGIGVGVTAFLLILLNNMDKSIEQTQLRLR